MKTSAKYDIRRILPTDLVLFLIIILIFRIASFFPFVKRQFIPASNHASDRCLPKMPTDTSPVINIRTCTLPEPVPYLLRHIGISSDPAVSCHSHLQLCTLGVVSNSVNVRAAKTKCHCNLILPNHFVFCISKLHFASFLLYVQLLNTGRFFGLLSICRGAFISSCFNFNIIILRMCIISEITLFFIKFSFNL